MPKKDSQPMSSDRKASFVGWLGGGLLLAMAVYFAFNPPDSGTKYDPALLADGIEPVATDSLGYQVLEDFNVYGVMRILLDTGDELDCGQLNNRELWHDGSQLSPTFIPSLPETDNAIEVLSLTGLGIDGIDPAPYWEIKGAVRTILNSLGNELFLTQANGTKICVNKASPVSTP